MLVPFKEAIAIILQGASGGLTFENYNVMGLFTTYKRLIIMIDGFTSENDKAVCDYDRGIVGGQQ